MARALAQLGVREVASLAGVTPNTVSRIENGSDAKQSTLLAIRKVYEDQGIRFVNAGETSGAPSVYKVAH